jgi:outer membrane protein assembly factor BamE (lipoprotein component of BamABCDE complex)
MIARIKMLRLTLARALVLAAALVLSACNTHTHLRQANVDEVVEGMSKKQVESILGPPTSVDTTDLILKKKTTYVYRQGPDTVTIVFSDDKVQSKEGSLSH